MRKEHFFFITLFMAGICMALPHAWINEIHYDNSGSDRNEFVEVIVESPEEYYLGDLALYMYNGYDGMPYCLDTVDEFDLGDREGPFQIYTWFQRGIQNDTEGMILVFKDTLVDILAYEGTFTGNNPPAQGEIFPDIGIYETGSGPDTNSIYLLGMPGSSWQYGPATPGELNTGQELTDDPLPVEMKNFNALFRDDHVEITWTTESEIENSGFNLYKNGDLLQFIQGRGSSSAPFDYVVIDEDILPGDRLIYSISEIDFDMNEIFLDTVMLDIHVIYRFKIGRLYPNPANSGCKLPLNVLKETDLSVDLYDMAGRKVINIFNDMLSTGYHELSLNMDHLPSGKYIISYKTDKMHDTRKFIHLK